MATLKLPFELEKPDTSTPVTKSSGIYDEKSGKWQSDINEEVLGGKSSGGSYYLLQNNSSAPSPRDAITAADQNIREYYSGLTIYLNLKYPIQYAGQKFKINSLAEKNLTYRGGTDVGGIAYAGDTVTIIYNGTSFAIVGVDRYLDSSAYYAKCDTPSSQSGKVVSVPDNYVLTNGNILTVKFAHGVGVDDMATISLRRKNGTMINNLELWYNDARKPLPIEDGSTVVMTYNETSTRWEIQSSTAQGEPEPPSSQIIIQDSYNYDTNDDNAVPTAKAAAEIAKDEIHGVIWAGTQAEYDAITTKNPDTIYFIKEG